MVKEVTIKYVKKARRWCRTIKLGIGKKGRQTFKQEWFFDKPSLKINLE